jgi:hypothetical protein
MPGIASAATACDRLYRWRHQDHRVDRAGVMLPNHAPLVIAEQFGTLESFTGAASISARPHWHRQRTARALRWDWPRPPRVSHDHGIAGPADRWGCQMVRAVPGADCGSRSGCSDRARSVRQLAAMLGLPFAFASHFALRADAGARCIARFQPSEQLSEPYAMVGVVSSPLIPMPRRDVSTSLQQHRQPATRHADPCRRSTTWMNCRAGRRSRGGTPIPWSVLRRHRAGAAFIAETVQTN